MQKAILLSCALLLSGCSFFPGIHRIEVQQGHMVDQNMVNQLQPGMTQEQVRFVMGSPLLVDTFNTHRWDYLYSLEKANGEVVKRQLSLYFGQDGRLSNIQGHYRPGAEEAPNQ